MTTLRRVVMLCLSPAFAGAAFAAGSGDPGTTFALNLTATTTILIIAILFFILVLPEPERRRLAVTIGSLRGSAAAGESADAEMADHVYDNIRELDNRIPPWFTTLFLGTIVFAVAYMASYHVLGSSPLMIEEYRQEIAEADLQRRVMLAKEGTIDENTLVPLVEPAALDRGKEVFGKYCVSCHGAAGTGCGRTEPHRRVLDPRGRGHRTCMRPSRTALPPRA